MIFILERIIYFITAFLFLIIPFLLNPSNLMVNQVLTFILITLLLYHFFLSNYLKKLNTLHIGRMFLKNYIPYRPDNRTNPVRISRHGDIVVTTLFIMYLCALFVVSYFKIITWNILIFGLFLLLGLNNRFKYKLCLVNLIAYKNRINCCSDCHICAWDNTLIFSILPFLFYIFKLNPINTVLIILIMLLSASEAVLWEWKLHFHPERFSPYTNDYLSCARCGKPVCNGISKKKFTSKNRP